MTPRDWVEAAVIVALAVIAAVMVVVVVRSVLP